MVSPNPRTRPRIACRHPLNCARYYRAVCPKHPVRRKGPSLRRKLQVTRIKGGSTHREEGHFFALFVAGHALGARVERWFSVDQEEIMMVTVAQRNLRVPAAVGLATHWIGGGIPI